jgi:hypothetical protein
MRIINRKSDLLSKSIAIVGVLIVFLMFTLAAYLNSFLKGHIDKNLFTVSQSLAYGNKPAMGVMLTIGIGMIMFLNVYRGLNFLYLRLFLLLVCYSLILTIFWVTTYYNRRDHYIIALTIFTCAIAYIFLNSIALYMNKGYNTFGLIGIILVPIFAVLGFIGLIISLTPKINNKVPQIFPSFENFMLLMKGMSVILLGFA